MTERVTMREAAFVAVKTTTGWIRQGRQAEEMLRAHGATDETTLIEMADIHYESFCLLVEAFHALGVSVDPEIMDLAKMGPVEP